MSFYKSSLQNRNENCKNYVPNKGYKPHNFGKNNHKKIMGLFYGTNKNYLKQRKQIIKMANIIASKFKGRKDRKNRK